MTGFSRSTRPSNQRCMLRMRLRPSKTSALPCPAAIARDIAAGAKCPPAPVSTTARTVASSRISGSAFGQGVAQIHVERVARGRPVQISTAQAPTREISSTDMITPAARSITQLHQPLATIAGRSAPATRTSTSPQAPRFVRPLGRRPAPSGSCRPGPNRWAPARKPHLVEAVVQRQLAAGNSNSWWYHPVINESVSKPWAMVGAERRLGGGPDRVHMDPLPVVHDVAGTYRWRTDRRRWVGPRPPAVRQRP